MTITQSLRIAAVTFLLSAPFAHGENLDVLLSQVFPQAQATYIGYESVEREDIPASASVERKYLIVDFRLASSQLASELLQASVHKVCMALVRLISYAFRRQTQNTTSSESKNISQRDLI